MYLNHYWLFGPSSVSSLIMAMAAVIVTWFPTIPSVKVARRPIIVAVPTVMLPRAFIISPAPTPTIFMVVVTRIAGIIRAWVIIALA
jgi:hypothetical protein